MAWDASTGKQIGKALTGHRDFVWSVAWSPNGMRLASGSDDETVRLWTLSAEQRGGPAWRVVMAALLIADLRLSERASKTRSAGRRRLPERCMKRVSGFVGG